MSEAPKEIWCSTGLYYEYKTDWSEGEWSVGQNGFAEVKYVRADLVYTRADVETAVLQALHGAASEAYYACGCQDAIRTLNPRSFIGEGSDE